jgi:glycosyltransferase involved in cell wall biosynthesis
MRVLIVSHLALPHVGGVEVLVDKEIRALAAAGHEVALITSDGGGSGETPAYPPSVRVICVPAWHFLEQRFRVPYPIFSPKLLWALIRELSRCDVVHAHGFMFMNSAIALWLARLSGKRTILTDHGGIQAFASRSIALAARLGAETVGRLSACCSDKLVTYNTRVGTLLERFSRTRRRSLFLPNPVDRALFRPATSADRQRIRAELGWPPERKKVLFVSRLTVEKGVPLLLQAADAAYDLVFCGPGDPGILGPLPREKIEYFPARPQAEVVRLYQAADLFALPTGVREGFPLVVQEALACGLPAVVGYDPGFEPYRVLSGLTFCAQTREAVTAAIRAALAKPRVELDQAALDSCCPDVATWLARLYA